MNEKPLLFADSRTDAEKFDPRLHRGTLDPSRVPGYSEQVMANDIAKADDLYFRSQNAGRTKEDVYREVGGSPGVLPVEFAWLPISGVAGADISSAQARQLDSYTNAQGFRLATREDLDRHGYGFPPAARAAEDGTIRRGPDVALYVRSGEVARMWDAFKNEEQRALEGRGPEEFTSRGEARVGGKDISADGGYATKVYAEDDKHETLYVRH